jgi:hypothetical protein
MMEGMRIIEGKEIERIGPDYQQAFGHLAYIVGRLVEADNPVLRDDLIEQARRVVESVYTPMYRAELKPVEGEIDFRLENFSWSTQSTPPVGLAGQRTLTDSGDR